MSTKMDKGSRGITPGITSGKGDNKMGRETRMETRHMIYKKTDQREENRSKS